VGNRPRLPEQSAALATPTFRLASRSELEALRRCREWLERLDRGELTRIIH
jgi:hypothetical protein